MTTHLSLHLPLALTAVQLFCTTGYALSAVTTEAVRLL